MLGPPCCRPAGTDLLACLEAAEYTNILPHPGLGEAALPRELISTQRNNSKDTASSISLKLGNIFSHWTLLRKSLLCKTHRHMAGVFHQLRRRRRSSDPTDEERQKLEAWIRLRFQLASSDPMMALIGAFGRLTAAGMTEEAATKTVLRILRESDPGGRP